MTDPDLETEQPVKPLDLVVALGWSFAPVAVAIGLLKYLLAVFPSVDVGLLLVAVAIPEAALLCAFGIWRRRKRGLKV
jgi:hypothetical protein